ncbi:MAG: DUF4340 domain-containing protein [Thermoanaerobaculia bacterium]|nr:DUF4340 domain-containing protein [Thermoanaerobaculia bacterium]
MKPRTLLVLALLVAGLGAFVWFYERELPSTDERAELAKRLLKIDAGEVERVEIEWDGKKVELARSAASEAVEEDTGAAPEWRLTAPLEARADTTAVSGLVERLVALETERTLEEADREEAGLGSPRGTVRLVTEGGEEVVEIGAEVPASSNMIVGVEGRGEIYVVPASIWSDLTKEPSAWRDKKLFFGERAAIERVSLARGDERMLLARRGDEFWLEAPMVDRAAQSHVDSLLATLVALRASRFVDDPPADLAELGLEPPRAVIEVVLTDRAAPLEYEIGTAESRPEGDEGETAAEQTLYLRANGELVAVGAALADHLERPIAAWRSHELAGMEVYEIDRASIEDDTGKTSLERDGGEWLRDGEKIVYGPATDFLYELVGARAERLAAEEEIDLSTPRLTVELVAEGDEEGEGARETLTLYAPVDGLVPARSSERPVVLLLPAEATEALEKELADLRDAELEASDEETAEEASRDPA